MSAVTGVVSPVEGVVTLGFVAPWWPPGVPRRQLMAPLMINSAAAAMPPRSLRSRRPLHLDSNTRDARPGTPAVTRTHTLQASPALIAYVICASLCATLFITE